jgi:hypothetical protein
MPDPYLTKFIIASISLTAVLLTNSGSAIELSQVQRNTDLIRSFKCTERSVEAVPDTFKQIELRQSWCGYIPKELRSAAPTKRYINSQSEWVKLWKTYRPNQAVPKIDFDRELIVIYVHFDANTLYLSPILSHKGELALRVSFTEAGMADTPCSYVFASVERWRVKSIDGKPLGNSTSKKYVF